MNSTRKDLIALATTMPEAALWTAYIVLKAVENTHDSVEKEDSKQVPDSTSPTSNIVDIRDARASQPKHARADTVRETHATVANLHPIQNPPEPEQRRVADGIRRIRALRRHIRQAEAMGQPTDLAKGLLFTFLRSLELMRDHLDIMQHRVRPSVLG